MRVIANSLPKSGTHLLCRILDLLDLETSPLHFSASLLRRTSRNPFRNAVKLWETDYSGQGIWIDLDKKRYIKPRVFEGLLGKFSDGSYAQGHLPYSETLVEALSAQQIKMLYIIRDPRDVLISHFYHHYRDINYQGYGLMNSMASDHDRIKTSLYGFLRGTEFETASLRERIANSIGWYTCNADSVLPVKFENLIGERGGGSEQAQSSVLVEMEHFLDLHQGRLRSMKEEVFCTKASTFRKGMIGDWRNYLDENLQELIKEQVGDYLVRLGYEKVDAG